MRWLHIGYTLGCNLTIGQTTIIKSTPSKFENQDEMVPHWSHFGTQLNNMNLQFIFDLNMLPHRSHFNWYFPPRKVVVNWTKISHLSHVVYYIFQELTLLKEAHITYSKSWHCWKSTCKDVTSHLFCMLWTHVSSEDAFGFTGPCAFGTVQRGGQCGGQRGGHRQGTRDRSSCFLWGWCWQRCVPDPEKDCYIFDPKKKKTNPLCIFVMWRARFVAFASNFPQRLQRRDDGALMLHSSRALLRLVLLLRRDLALDELLAEDDKVEEDASATVQLQAPKQAQASRGRVPHWFMCCLRVAADVKDFLQ